MKRRKRDVAVRGIENASKCPHEIDKWIQSLEDLHHSKPFFQIEDGSDDDE